MRIAFLLLAMSFQAAADCPGLQGFIKDRCLCYEGLAPPAPEEVRCRKPEDCLALEDGCGGWFTVNKSFRKKVAGRNTDYVKGRKVSLAQDPLRPVTCDPVDHYCRFSMNY